MTFTTTANPAQSALAEASAALQQGQPGKAILAARRAAAYDPDALHAWWLWGLAAIETYAFAEAEAALEEGAKRVPSGNPLLARFLTQRARALIPLGKGSEAVELVHQALAELEKTGSTDAATLHLLATSLSHATREEEALPLLIRATQMDPNVAAYWSERGDTEQFLGRIGDAERSFEAAIAGQPQPWWGAHFALSRLKRWTKEHNHIDRLKATPAHHPLDEARRGYALFKELDDTGNYAEAWDWLQKGAEAGLRQPTTPRNPRWLAQDEREVVAAWKRFFPAGRFAGGRFVKVPPQSSKGPRRLFIVGLPRSGTTLVERILSAHSQVQGLGELQTFPAATKLMSGAQGWRLVDAETVQAASQLDPQTIANFYDAETAYLGDGHPVTTDKLPHNSDYVGLIRLAYPDAAIVHVRREPLDALFGAYKLHFAANWSFSLDDIADHYANHRELMQHWQACLGDGLIDVSLEGLIADPEVQIRRLLEACGLPFEEACLRPHEAAGAVASASSSQVRKPINAEGVGAWKRYAVGLMPLRMRLEAMGAIDADGRGVWP